MQYRFFDISAADAEQAEQELNRFVRSHRVISVQKELVREVGGAYWALCVEYLVTGDSNLLFCSTADRGSLCLCISV